MLGWDPHTGGGWLWISAITTETRHERVLELRGLPAGVLLGEDRSRGGRMRRGHRGARQLGVIVADQRAYVRAGSTNIGDATPGAAMSGLSEPTPARGPRLESLRSDRCGVPLLGGDRTQAEPRRH
jgi:hypothetical protein